MSTEASPALRAAARPAPGWAAGEFEAVFEADYARLARRLAMLAGDQAEDVAQEAFVRLYRQPPPRRQALAGWLYRTASRIAIDRLRSGQRRNKYERAAGREHAIVSGPEGERAALEAERRAAIRACLAQLPWRQSQILWLRHSGESYQEIALALELKAGSVGTLLARAEAAFARAYRRRERKMAGGKYALS